jgi:hypothetical protein
MISHTGVFPSTIPYLLAASTITLLQPTAMLLKAVPLALFQSREERRGLKLKEKREEGVEGRGGSGAIGVGAKRVPASI